MYTCMHANTVDRARQMLGQCACMRAEPSCRARVELGPQNTGSKRSERDGPADQEMSTCKGCCTVESNICLSNGASSRPARLCFLLARAHPNGLVLGCREYPQSLKIQTRARRLLPAREGTGNRQRGHKIQANEDSNSLEESRCLSASRPSRP